MMIKNETEESVNLEIKGIPIVLKPGQYVEVTEQGIRFFTPSGNFSQ